MDKILELKDFLDFKFIGQPKWNNKGDVLAFLVANANYDENNYESYLYVYKDGNYTQLTSSGKESSFYWDDDETIVFSNIRDKKDKEKVEAGEELTVYYKININGGEATKLFSIPLSVDLAIRLCDQKLLLQVSFNEEYSIAYNMNDEDKKKLLEKKKEMEDYHVLTQVPFYSNGAGYINNDRTALFLFDQHSFELQRLTKPYMEVEGVEVDYKNKRFYYTAAMFETVAPLKPEIYVFDVETQETSLVLDAVLSIHDFQIEEDHILIGGAATNDFGINENPKFYRNYFDERKLQLVNDYDASIGSSVGSDARYLGGQQMKLHKHKYYFISTIDDGSELRCLDENNEITTLIKYEGSIDSFDIVDDKIAFVGMKDGKLQEVYLMTSDIEQITHFNEEILKDKYVADYEELRFERDGYELHGWVLKPKDFDASKQYPAILDIHGGPKTVYGPVFYHEMQVWANKGAFVFFMNPRGSDGRGNEFSDIRGQYGTGDYDDLMLFTDLVLDTYPCIDRNKVAVTGGSYGGFMTNWIIGHTDRFVSAASQRSIANWVGFTYSSDIGPYFATDQQGTNMFEDVDKLWWHSPLKYAQSVTTPTLFIHSDEDFRCPYFEGIQMYGALMEQGVPTRLVMFKGENHELSRSGKPKHRVKRLEEITDWLFKYFN